MKQLFTSFIVGVAAAAACNNAAASASAGTTLPFSMGVKSAAPSQTSPASAPEEDPETELTLFGLPDLENRPER